MGEISVNDVEAFTGGRLEATADETRRILEAALAVARNYCGWHVSPVREGETLTLDGRGGSVVFPPTRKIVDLIAVSSDGVEVPLTDLAVPSEAPWKIVYKTGTWSVEYGGIIITMDHGYTEMEASDWRNAILMMCDQMGSTVGRPDSALLSKQIDDVAYRWMPLAEQVLFEVKPVLDSYTPPLRAVDFA